MRRSRLELSQHVGGGAHRSAAASALWFDDFGVDGDGAAMAVIVDCPSAYVVDGDSLRCGSERLRLLGVDAPELHGCPPWRTCEPGDGKAAKRSLRAAIGDGHIRYRLITRDRFGRAVVVAWAGRINLSCWQISKHQAVYKPHWDNGGIIARSCR